MGKTNEILIFFPLFVIFWSVHTDSGFLSMHMNEWIYMISVLIKRGQRMKGFSSSAECQTWEATINLSACRAGITFNRWFNKLSQLMAHDLSVELAHMDGRSFYFMQINAHCTWPSFCEGISLYHIITLDHKNIILFNIREEIMF